MAKYQCPTCPAGTSDPVALADHRLREHGERVHPNDARLPLDQIPSDAPARPAVRELDPAAPRGGRHSADQQDRIEWQLNQIRVSLLLLIAIVGVGLLLVPAVLA